MSIHHLEAAAELNLHAARKLVLMALADDANKVTRVTFPEREKLIIWSGVKDRRVAQIIDELIALQLLARTRFGQPGARAEFIVFPTEDELEALDDRSPALNAVSESTLQRLHDEDERERQKLERAAAKAAEKASTKPVDNPQSVGATDCTHADGNGCNFGPNGCNSYCTPPVITSRLVNQSSENVTIELAVENPGPDEKKSPTRNTPSPAAMPHHIADIDIELIRSRCWRTLEPTGINDAELRELCRRIVAKSPVRVLNPTHYVIRAIRQDHHEWEAEAHAIAVAELTSTVERAGNDF